MWVYIITFIISILFIFVSENKINNKLISKIFIIIGLLIPCVIAGLRYETIGTDILVYVKPLFECVKRSTSFSDYLTLHCVGSRFVYNFEIGFSFLVYIVTKLGGNLNAVLFFIQFFTIIPIYLGLKKLCFMRGKIWMGMLVYFLMFYNTSLNAMRQYISIAIIFYAICILLADEKDFKCIILILLASFFHNSAYLGIILYLFYKLFNFKSKLNIVVGNNKIRFKNLLFLLTIVLVFIAMLNTNVISFLLNDVGLSYYSRYIDGNVRFASSSFIKALPIIIIFIVARKDFIAYKNSNFLILMFIMNIIMSQFATIHIFAIRIAYLFSSFNIISFPLLIKSNFHRKKLIFIAIIIYLFVYWYYNFVYSGYSETIPYIFA